MGVTSPASGKRLNGGGKFGIVRRAEARGRVPAGRGREAEATALAVVVCSRDDVVEGVGVLVEEGVEKAEGSFAL